MNLFAAVDNELGMVAILDHVSYESNELALETVEVADSFAVMFGHRGVKRALLLGRTEREVDGAALQCRNPENLACHASVFTYQFGAARGGEAFDLHVGNGRRGACALLRNKRRGEQQSDAEKPRRYHFVGSILSELLKRLK